MLSSRFISAALALALLSACGFRPLFGTAPESDAAADLAAIEVEQIPDRIGQQLRNRLIDLFDTVRAPDRPRYRLRVTLVESTQKLAVERDQTATRANYNLTAEYVLFNGQTQLFRSIRSVISSYNILVSDYATLSAERDAKNRATREIGDAIRTSLAVYFTENKNGATPAGP